MRVGITGFPFSGKTTVLAALAGENAPVAKHGEAPRAVVSVPDPRLERLAMDYRAKKYTHATIEYFEAGAGESGFDQTRLAHLRTADVLLLVVRAFDDPGVPHPKKRVDPAADLRDLLDEMTLADQVMLDSQRERIERTLKLKKDAEAERRLALAKKLLAPLSEGKPARSVALGHVEEAEERGWGLLTRKPVVACVDVGESGDESVGGRLRDVGGGMVSEVVSVCAKLEAEIAQLPEEERAAFLVEIGEEEPAADRVARATLRAAGLITFFTVSEKEVRTWLMREGGTALDAAATVHSDMARGFIRAEVLPYSEYDALGGWNAAKAKGRVRLEGRETPIHDGDVVFVRFNV